MGDNSITGRPCIHLAWKVPASEEKTMDAFWKEHEEWMRASHTMGVIGAAEPRLLHFHIAKGPELENPLDPQSKPTGKIVYVMSESYATDAGIAKHMELGNKDKPDWFKKMVGYNEQYGCHIDIGSTRNFTALHDTWQPSIYKAGDPCIHMVWKVPKQEEKSLDDFWKQHETWMRQSHQMAREGDDSTKPRLTSFNIRKGPEMENPLDPKTKPTGNLLYIMSETYAAGTGIAKHMELGQKDMAEWFKKLMEYDAKYCRFKDMSSQVFTFLDK
jgi:hypothetical protein